MSYFENDCLEIASAARHSDKVFLETVTMVLLSIQQPWQGVPAQFAHVRAHGRDSIYLFGSKRGGYDYASEHVSTLRIASQIAYDKRDLDGLLMEYLNIPGLGLVKASFLAQLTMADGACIDLHNARRLGLTPNDLKMPKALKEASKLARISSYNATWQAHGDSAYWWDTWCDNMVGTSFNKRLTTGAHASAIHRLPLE